MEHVELYGFHTIQIALENVEGNKVTRHVDHQTTPLKARSVLDADRGSGEAIGRDGNQLKKRLKTAKSAERVCGVKFGAGGCHFECVGFVFTDFLNGFAFVIS